MVIDSIQQRQIVRFRFKYRYVERGQYRHVPCAPDDGWAYSLRAALLVARKLDNINTYDVSQYRMVRNRHCTYKIVQFSGNVRECTERRPAA